MRATLHRVVVSIFCKADVMAAFACVGVVVVVIAIIIFILIFYFVAVAVHCNNCKTNKNEN